MSSGMNLKDVRGEEYIKLSQGVVIKKHLSPIGEYPKEIRKLVQYKFGAAHKNKRTNIVEVGARNGTTLNDMWFWYRIVKDSKGRERGIIEEPYLFSGWYERSRGKCANYPSVMGQALRANPEGEY